MDAEELSLEKKTEQVLKSKEKKKERLGSLYQLFICALVNISVLGPSMGFGYSAIALPVLRSNSTDGLHLNEQQASWIASASAISTPLGCILSSYILRRGRKISLLATSLVSLSGWLTIYFSNTYEQILTGRFLSGIATGLASVPATVYSAEVSSPKLRSTTLTWTSTAIAIGVLIVYIYGYIFPKNWKLVALLCAIFPVIAIVLVLTIIPESPMWLKQRGRLAEAAEVLKKFHGLAKDDELSEGLKAQIAPVPIQRIHEQNMLKNLKSRKSIVPFAIMLTFFFFQQFSGIFAVVYYAVDVTVDAGLTIDGYIGAILIGVTRFVGTLVIASISKKFGRRLPSITSGAGMSIFMLILSIYLILKDHEYSINDKGLIPAICILMFIFMSTIGFLSLPFAMIGEIYPASVKDILSGVTTCIAYIFSFITVKIYPDMSVLMGKAGVFLFYAVMSFFGTIFVFYFLPETKGKSLAEIENYFHSKKTKQINVEESANIDDAKMAIIPLKCVTSNS